MSGLRNARIQRIIDFANDVKKLNEAAQKRGGKIPSSKLQKLRDYSLSFTAMKEDEILHPAAVAFLKVIDLYGDIQGAMKAKDYDYALEIGKEIEKLLWSTRGVSKNVV